MFYLCNKLSLCRNLTKIIATQHPLLESSFIFVAFFLLFTIVAGMITCATRPTILRCVITKSFFFFFFFVLLSFSKFFLEFEYSFCLLFFSCFAPRILILQFASSFLLVRDPRLSLTELGRHWQLVLPVPSPSSLHLHFPITKG